MECGGDSGGSHVCQAIWLVLYSPIVQRGRRSPLFRPSLLFARGLAGSPISRQ
jgi:hypothetical protein